MVVNIGRALAGDWPYVEEDIRQVVAVAAKHDAIVKVIFETGLLQSEEQKIELCRCSERAGAANLSKHRPVSALSKEQMEHCSRPGATREDIMP